MALDNYCFRMLREEDLEMVMDFVLVHYLGFHPITTHLQLKQEDARIYLEPIIKHALCDGASMAVFEKTSAELCGVRINLLGKNQGRFEPPPPKLEDQSLTSRQYSEVDCYIIGKDISETFQTKNYMFLFLTAVQQDHGNRGLATELYRRSEALARKKKISVLTVICLNLYTLMATTKLGFRVRKQIKYEDYIDPITKQKIFVGMKKPHVHMVNLYKQLET